ncbi:PIN domain-containing protein [Saccharopolyspora shandongensis]|uniref:PIN domain-containing protein n=1 Tax=Saccharopolyspora shandongensis TaxID=418495 RepID=UPI0015A4F2B9
MVTILEAPDSAHKEAMLREARRKVPAKTDWNNPGSGARDAVIWLTALHACRDRQEDVYFVSANTKDFGKGELKKDLVDEARTLLGDTMHASTTTTG